MCDPGQVISLLMPQFVLTQKRGYVKQDIFSCKEQKAQLKTAEAIKSRILRSGREEGPGGLYRLLAVVKHPVSFHLSALAASAQNNCSSDSGTAQSSSQRAEQQLMTSKENRSSKPLNSLALEFPTMRTVPGA